jgi:Leucine-rich repeat (LRR) protein
VTSIPPANNWLSGTLPSSLQQLTNLRKLTLGANFLSGPLPQWLGELRSLKELRLGANMGTGTDGSRGFNGTLHASLGQLAKLQVRHKVGVKWPRMLKTSLN